MALDAIRPKASRKCPVCRKPPTSKDAPFCSQRCKDVDLHRWLVGAYAIPGRPEEAEDEEGVSPHSGQPKGPPL